MAGSRLKIYKQIRMSLKGRLPHILYIAEFSQQACMDPTQDIIISIAV